MKYGSTIHDVAKRSGYSIATVSRVVNNQGGVRKETEIKIKNAIDDLGYRRNAIARSMVKRETHTIGILIPDIKNPFFSRVFSEIEKRALDSGYFTILSNSFGDTEIEKKILSNFLEKGIDGLIVTSSNENNEFFDEYIKANIPVIALDRPLKYYDFDHVLSGNREGAYQAIVHLIQRGYKNIAIIRGNQDTTPGLERYKGYIDALNDNNIDIVEEWIIDGDFGEKSGYKAVNKLLDLKHRPDAIFSCNNLMSIGAVKSLSDHEWKIGHTLGFVGYDDIEIATFHKPNLTVIDRDMEKLGEVAFNFVINRIKGKVNATDKQIFTITPSLIIRQSSEKN